MKTISIILYATDFSESSKPASDYALTLAKLTGGKVHVLHVIDEFSDSRKSMIQPEAMILLEREVEIQALKEMAEFCKKRFNGEIPFTTDVVMGIPFQEIIKKASELPADLIVVGTHGLTGMEHVIVGSTAERVVRRSKIPVLTVRSES
jgi:nucleotide-binding universal stress UspA family protein